MVFDRVWRKSSSNETCLIGETVLVEKCWFSCQIVCVHNFDLNVQSTVLLRELLNIAKVEGVELELNVL